MSGRGSERILALIEWMAERTEPATLAQAVSALELPKSSTLGLLRTLVDLGYVERFSATHYRLIRIPGEIGGKGRAAGTLLRLLEPIVLSAVERARETGFLAVLNPDNTVKYLNKILPDREIRYDRDTTIPRRAHQVSSGLVLLGGLSETELDSYAETASQLPGENATPDEIVVEVTAAKARGYAVTKQGVVEGAAGVAAPIFGTEGQILAALNIAGPALRMSGDLDRIAALVTEIAWKATEELGQSNLFTGTNKKS